MIIIINGSLGVGKTSISEELLWKYEKTVMLDGDALGNVNPFDIYDQNRIMHLYKTIELLAKFHKDAGFDNIIINYVFESSKSLRELTELLVPIDRNIFSFWITCEEEIQKNRIVKRNRDNLEWELKRFIELQRIQRIASQEGFIGIEIDSSNKSIDEIGNTIIDRINLN